jgi:hypothetical protein
VWSRSQVRVASLRAMLALRTKFVVCPKTDLGEHQRSISRSGGTNPASGARFHRYRDEIASTWNDREKFATHAY